MVEKFRIVHALGYGGKVKILHKNLTREEADELYQKKYKHSNKMIGISSQTLIRLKKVGDF